MDEHRTQTDRSDLCDEEIVERFFARDESALLLLKNRHGKSIRALCANLLGSDEDAEECLDDVLLRVWQSIPPARPAHLGAYCVKIARGIALDRLRKSGAQRRVPSFLIDAQDESNEPTSGLNETENAVLSGELTALINTFLGKLPERARLIFLYRFYFGMPIGRIAELSECSERAVYQSLEKTKKQLEACLKKEGYRP